MPDAALTPMVIIGAGGHARVVADLIRSAGAFRVVAFLDTVHAERAGEMFCGAPVVRDLDALATLRTSAGLRHGVIAVGDCQARLRLAPAVETAGITLVTVCHPGAIVSPEARVGAGSVIVAGAVVNAGAVLGAQVIVNTSASVDHECVLGDGVHVGPGARLGGRVEVGRGAWIGIGAVVRDGLRIGAGAIVGAGGVVVADVPDDVVVYGNPARVVRAVSS